MRSLFKKVKLSVCVRCTNEFKPSAFYIQTCPDCKAYTQAFEDGKNSNKSEILTAIAMLESGNASYERTFDSSKLVTSASKVILQNKSYERRLNNRQCSDG